MKLAKLHRAVIRRDRDSREGSTASACSALESRHRNGFTLIETMTSVAIIAVLAASAMPTYSSFLRNSEIRSATDSIAYGLRVARKEAIKRNAVVSFTIAAEGGSPTWAVKQASDDSAIQSSSAQEIGAHIKVVAKPTEAASVAFSPLGMVMADTAEGATIQQLAIASTTSEGTQPLQINIDGKYIRVCDPSPLLAPPNPRACSK